VRRYLLRVFDGLGQQFLLLEKEFTDDLSALEFARLLARENTVEIWDRGYRVAHVKVRDEPATVTDVVSG
jgi:hypothetical protein